MPHSEPPDNATGSPGAGPVDLRAEETRLREALAAAVNTGDVESQLGARMDLISFCTDHIAELGYEDTAPELVSLVDETLPLIDSLQGDESVDESTRTDWSGMRPVLEDFRNAAKQQIMSDEAHRLSKSIAHMSRAGAEASAIGDFQTSRDRMAEAESLSLKLLAMLTTELPAGASDDVRRAWENLRSQQEIFLRTSRALQSLVVANLARMSRDPSAASAEYGKAADLFLEAASLPEGHVWTIHANAARALQTFSQGLDQLDRGSPTTAAALLMQARSAFERVLEEDVPRMRKAHPESEGNLTALLKTLPKDAASIEATFNLAKFQEQRLRRDWRAALRYADEYERMTLRTIETTPPGGPVDVHLLRFGLSAHLANRQIVEGELSKDERRWGDAIKAYEEARAHFDAAGAAVLRSRVPAAAAIQETLFNQAASNLDLLIRDAEAQERIYAELTKTREDLSRLQQSLADLGINVNVTTSVEQKQQLFQQQQFVVKLEESVRGTLQELLEAAEMSDLEPELKRRASDKAKELLKSEEKGVGFLERAKAFASDLASVVTSATTVVGPFIPLVKKLLTQLGVGVDL
jgi:hypothetical protein